MTELYKQIKTRAKAKGMTIQQLSKEVGISPMTLNKWRLQVPKTIEIWLRIDNVLGEQTSETE